MLYDDCYVMLYVLYDIAGCCTMSQDVVQCRRMTQDVVRCRRMLYDGPRMLSDVVRCCRCRTVLSMLQDAGLRMIIMLVNKHSDIFS